MSLRAARNEGSRLERREAKGAQKGCAMTDYSAGRLRPKAGKNHDRLRSVAEHPKGGCMAAHEGRYGMKCAGMRPGLACVFLSRRRVDSRPLFPSHTHTTHTHTTNTHTERLTRKPTCIIRRRNNFQTSITSRPCTLTLPVCILHQKEVAVLSTIRELQA